MSTVTVTTDEITRTGEFVGKNRVSHKNATATTTDDDLLVVVETDGTQTTYTRGFWLAVTTTP